MQAVDVIVVGGGPCGLSAAIECQKAGLNTIVIEKGNIVNAIYNYPTHQTFFSTSERLAIGDVPFIIEERKPRRNQALVYYPLRARQQRRKRRRSLYRVNLKRAIRSTLCCRCNRLL